MCLFLYGTFCHGDLKLEPCLHCLPYSFCKHLFNLYYVKCYVINDLPIKCPFAEPDVPFTGSLI